MRSLSIMILGFAIIMMMQVGAKPATSSVEAAETNDAEATMIEVAEENLENILRENLEEVSTLCNKKICKNLIV